MRIILQLTKSVGYAYIAGSCYDTQCKLDRSNSKGLYAFDVSNPLAPEVSYLKRPEVLATVTMLKS